MEREGRRGKKLLEEEKQRNEPRWGGRGESIRSYSII